MFFPRLLLVVSLALPASMTTAHEFWIEPLRYQIDNGGTLEADFKNGQEFSGNTLSYFERNSSRFDLAFQGTLTALSPRLGDSPALNVPAPVTDVLVSVVHETTPSLLTYRVWEKFLKFAKHKDFPNAAADHKAAGWSEIKFKESYTRHVKALIAVGNGEGSDQRLGLKTEFVALSNPYQTGFDNLMQVALYFEDHPRGNAQVEVFDRAPDETVTISLHRTDSAGRVTIPVTNGHDYLFDAVVLEPSEEASTEEGATVWQTFWAALTFNVPQ